MYPILFKIGSLTFYTHGVLAVFGIVLGSAIINALAKQRNLDRTLLFDNVIWSVLVGIIGARLAYFLLYRNQFDSLVEIFYLQNGGMVSFGGFVPGVIALYLLLKAQKQPLARWFDIISIGFAAGLFWGRIGNLMAGEYAGKISTGRFTIDGLIPINLYEGIIVALIGLLLYWVYSKNKNMVAGTVAWLFVLLYNLGRFVIDFWREERIAAFGLNLSQITCVILILVAVVALTRLNKNKVVAQN